MRIFLLVFLLIFFPVSLGAEAPSELVIATFDRCDPPNEVGGNYGAWNYNLSDPSQRCYSSPEPDDALGRGKGYSIRLDYDVLSSKPAFNGFWMDLGGIDLSPYDELSFWVKGDEQAGFTSRFKLELKNAFGEKAIYYVRGIQPSWQEITLNVKENVRSIDWNNMTELVIVFDDISSTKKEGSILIDQFVFRRAPSQDTAQ